MVVVVLYRRFPAFKINTIDLFNYYITEDMILQKLNVLTPKNPKLPQLGQKTE